MASRIERSEELVARGERLGLRFEFVGGVMSVTPTMTAEPDRQRGLIEEITKYLPELRSLLLQRAINHRVRQLAGQRVLSLEYGEGTVSGDGGNTGLVVSIRRGMSQRSASYIASANDVLVILEHKEPVTATEGETNSVKPPRGFVDRLLGRAED